MNARPYGLAVLSAVVLGAGCVVGGAGDGGGTRYGIGFYEPFDNYGSWGPGYLVGPPRRYEGEHGREVPDDRPGGLPHAYHPAPASHPIPSLPAEPREEEPNGR
jgi:hypothetical protein